MYVTAQRPIPPRIDTRAWRFILQAMLDEPVLASDHTSRFHLDKVFGKSVDYSFESTTEIGRRKLYQSHMQEQVRCLSHKLAILQAAVEDVDEISTTLHAIQRQQHALHGRIQQFQQDTTAECEKFERLRETISMLHFAFYGPRMEESAAEYHMEAISTRDRAANDYQKSSFRQIAMARAIAAVSTIQHSYAQEVTAAKKHRQAMLGELSELNLYEERTRVERDKWLQELAEDL